MVRHVGPALARLLEPGIAVEQRLYDALDPVVADPAAIERLVLAVARSARDAMPNGGTLTIETDTVFLDGETVSRWKDMSAGAYSMLLIRDTRPARRDSKPAIVADLDEARAIAEEAGGRVIGVDGQPLSYNKTDLHNPWFIVSGAGEYDWTQHVSAPQTQ